MKKFLSLAIVFLTVIAMSSCNTNDNASIDLSELYGEWGDTPGGEILITINEDNTLTLGERTYKLADPKNTASALTLTLKENGKEAGTVYYYLSSENSIPRLSVHIENDDQGYNLFKLSLYETHTVTLQNWQNYFDLVTDIIVNRNAFNEVESHYPVIKLCLKSQYTGKLASGDCAVEYELSGKILSEVEYDDADGSFSFTKLTEDEADARGLYLSWPDEIIKDTASIELGRTEISLHGGSYFPTTLNKNGTKYTMVAEKYENCGILRVQGELVFIK